MTIVEQRVCDVFGTSKDVQEVRVTIQTGTGENNTKEWDTDMGPRALKRLKMFIARSFVRPTPRKAK